MVIVFSCCSVTLHENNNIQHIQICMYIMMRMVMIIYLEKEKNRIFAGQCRSSGQRIIINSIECENLLVAKANVAGHWSNLFIMHLICLTQSPVQLDLQIVTQWQLYGIIDIIYEQVTTERDIDRKVHKDAKVYIEYVYL